MEFRFGDIAVAATNAERVVFPDAGLTKGDVLAYYRDVADVMLPELRARPLTLERFTKGLAGGGFYQKHYQKHFPAWVGRVELGKVVHPVCDDAASLVYFANQGALAFHVVTVRREALARPDVIVFDLDPPEGHFDLARRAAHAVRALLSEVELPAFLKTSGSKGLHVVVPTDGNDDYRAVERLCLRTTAVLVARHPDLLTTEFYKKDRGGRLFLDVFRNAPGATFVAAWSLRGRPGAPVSAPITWEELDDPALAADGIRLRDVRARLDAQGDPWIDLRARPASVARALERLS